MNGWQRLGVVVAGLISAPIFLFVHDDARDGHFNHYPSDIVSSLDGQSFADKIWLEARATNPQLAGCERETVRISRSYYDGNSATITCKIRHAVAFDESMWAIVIPFGVIFGLGYAIAWIRAGFRQ